MTIDTLALTTSGRVRGLTDGDVRTWRGIPYAAAPVGALRWQPPTAPTPWTEVREATHFGARAPQHLVASLVPPGGAEPHDQHTPFSEDCLHLNICAPAAPTAPAPVLVWFHGGGFVWGSGPHFIGDGRSLATEGVVVVTVNYRLGALGFLRLDHLLGDDYADSGNCGLLDQVAALRWVHDNIAAFGGDPNNVTLAGVSAGGKSVANLMATDAARGLFHRAIIHSGGDHVTTPADATELTGLLLDSAGLDESRAEELLHLPQSRLLEAQNALASGARTTWVWRPVVDGRTLATTPTHALANGAAAGIPVIAGTTCNEAGSYTLSDPTAPDQAFTVLESIFGDDADQVWNDYAAALPGAGAEAIGCAVLSDERYGVPTRHLLDAQSRHAPVWRYRFDAPSPGAPAEKSGFHGADIPFVWNVALDAATEQQRNLATDMRRRWVSFLTTGTPNLDTLEPWAQYRPGSGRSTMLFDLVSRVVPDPDSYRHAAWTTARQWTPGTWWPLPAAALPVQ
jgi:para-nitrobenzyl esterase